MTLENRPSDTDSRIIYSRNDLQIKRIRGLQTREGRDQSGQFLLEGVRQLAQAVEQKVRIETLIVAPALLQHPAGMKLAKRLRIQGTPCYRLTAELYYSISEAEEPQGIAAVARQRWEPLEHIRPSTGLCWIVAESIQAAGNLGTMLRTSAAVGAAGLILVGESTDPYASATLRATMGALFTQRLVRTTVEQFAVWKRHHQVTLIGAAPSASDDYCAVDYPRPAMLLMGCEKRGLSSEMLAMCDMVVRIPMVGNVDSLNVGVATSIMLYELFNQRRGAKRQGQR